MSKTQDRIEIAHFPETLDPHDPEQHAALITRLHPFDGILAMRERTPFKKETLTALPNLKLLLTTGTRNLALDTAYCAERGIPVAGTASRSSSGGVDSAAQHAWAVILALARHVARDDAALKRGEGLAGVTGRDVGRIAIMGFGMRVVAWSGNLTQETAELQAAACGLPRGSFRAITDKLQFFGQADVVSLHHVLSELSRGIVGRAELAAMRRTALLVNTSRGP
ncbi:hypothetical protein AOCH_001142 [Aspergillus ochraceoroseus]|uniref:D-isomer specific 2-hydroxyacid dehydrogenase NAD-binding domain-containing protein n=1 Tax=Aspergillus ochraceoroseus TaxID=138278 RepID=A0A0F8UTB1_9EURO|nr:hypothetical protein AOCH_001142 [Aspergillus ochraceoroseus]